MAAEQHSERICAWCGNRWASHDADQRTHCEHERRMAAMDAHGLTRDDFL